MLFRSEIVSIAKQSWNEIDVAFGLPEKNHHEAGLLILDNSKSIVQLKWKPVWNTTEAVQKTIEWYKEFYINKKVISKIQVNNFFNQISVY